MSFQLRVDEDLSPHELAHVLLRASVLVEDETTTGVVRDDDGSVVAQFTTQQSAYQEQT
jgi:hypothetical protein